MSFVSGSRLGPYEIRGTLGSGGMGTVYRAHDPRLARDIALKILPETVARDAESLARFTREARAVAALNHPHIVTIHSVEDEGAIVFLTMELVEGRSLADALPPAGLSLDRVLAIGIAVADAMSAAHQKGITHRDLKPANIMLGEGEQAGRIKVLDFGLAKIVEPQVEAPGSFVATEAPAPITAEGRILGTVAYMSPEQAEGRAIDGRSDLFSLGVVLYEMATGQRPFSGDTNLSILSAILKDPPRSVTDVNPALPRDLGRIIRRALAKDPERRYQSAKDLRNDLEDLKASLDSGELATPQTTTPVASAAPLIRRHSRALAATVVVLFVVIAALVMWLRREAQPSPDESLAAPSSIADLQITQLTTSGNADRPAISPDGRYVAYVQRDGDAFSLWLRQTTTTDIRRIVAPEPGVTLSGATFSPDSTSVDFVREPAGAPAEIWRVPFIGGTPRRLISEVSSAISWAPDGQRLAFLRTRRTPTLKTDVIVAAPNGGQEQTLATRIGLPAIVSLTAPWRPNIPPAWSPDGTLIAVTVAGDGGAFVLFVDSRTGSTREIAVQAGSFGGLVWLDAESLVVNTPLRLGLPGQMFRLPHAGGAASRLTNDPNDYIGVSVTSDRRSLVTTRRDALMDIWVGDGAASMGKDVVQRARVSVERLQWYGDRLLYGAAVGGGKPGVFRLTPGETTPEVVVSDALSPAVTTDGATMVFVSSDDLSLWTADAAGRRVIQLTRSVTAEPVAVSTDDRFVFYMSLADKTASIWMVPIGGGTPAKLAVGNNVDPSPDGESIAFAADAKDGRLAIVVCRLPACGSAREIGRVTDFRVPLRWTPDGRSVAYADQGNLWAQPLDGGPPRQLTRFTDARPIFSFAWSRDGKRLALTRTTVTDDIVLFSGLK